MHRTGRRYKITGPGKSLTTVSANDNDDDGMLVEEVENPERRALLTNLAAGGILVSSVLAGGQLFMTEAYTPSGFVRTQPIQFLAALGDPKANSGTTAKEWGIWKEDPGPRGVWLKDYQKDIVSKGGIAPVGWKFDPNDWWLEEHGLIMESPKFPVQPGRYLVTGGRQVVTGMTIGEDGSWKLDDPKATLYDVTHLPCRSARYSPIGLGTEGGPQTARSSDFPVAPGGIMPSVPGCNKQDYAVIFVVGKAV